MELCALARQSGAWVRVELVGTSREGFHSANDHLTNQMTNGKRWQCPGKASATYRRKDHSRTSGWRPLCPLDANLTSPSVAPIPHRSGGCHITVAHSTFGCSPSLDPGLTLTGSVGLGVILRMIHTQTQKCAYKKLLPQRIR